MPAYIVTGNIFEGFNYYGPFESADAARAFAEAAADDLEDEPWFVTELQASNTNSTDPMT